MALPLPGTQSRERKFGLLQSREPFIDPHDVVGSRDRALVAFRMFVERSLDEYGPLDWLAGGAFPLSGPGPFRQPLLQQVALSKDCPEMRSLASLATTHRVRLTLGAWWHDAGTGVAPRLIVFDGGPWRVLRKPDQRASAGALLQMPASPGNSSLLTDLADQCRQQYRFGVRVETLRGPSTPPGAPTMVVGGSAIISPDGRSIARASPTAETCLVAELS